MILVYRCRSIKKGFQEIRVSVRQYGNTAHRGKEVAKGSIVNGFKG